MTAIGEYRHRVTLGNPGNPVPDGDGGYTETFAPLDPPEWDCSIQAASTRDLESIGAGTVLSQATHLLKGRYHPGITTESRVLIGGAPQPYANLVIADGASHYWRLDELSGLVAKDIIGGATGTISGGVTLNQAGALMDGNKAMVFNGTTGKITTSALTLPSICTIELWFKTAVSSTQLMFFSNRDTSGDILIYREANHNIAAYAALAFNVNTPGPAPDGLWHHLVITQDGTTVRFYVDSVAGTSDTGVRSSSTNPVLIGADPSNLNWHHGSLDELAIYPTALTPTQIAAHYAAGTKIPDRILHVVFVANRDNRDLETNLVCVEVVA
jgi:Concanavalin A-like lectin/glucanases superfamily/Phage head-tail joining protein